MDVFYFVWCIIKSKVMRTKKLLINMIKLYKCNFTKKGVEIFTCDWMYLNEKSETCGVCDVEEYKLHGRYNEFLEFI